MPAYYNENDPKAAAWLRELIKRGHIADGEVDERSIVDVRPDELAGFTQCHFFAGIGGWSYALRLAGWSDDRPVWTGSCPCQPFSVAGKGAGTADARHLWPAFGWLIRQCRPSVVFGEQVASRAGRDWFATVRADLEKLGYAVGGADLCAAGIGAPHIRQRLYFVGHADHERPQRHRRLVAEHDQKRRENKERHERETGFWSGACWLPCRDGKARPVEPKYVALVDGLSGGVVSGGGDSHADETEEVDAAQEIDSDGGAEVRAMREGRLQAARSPQGREPGEQRAVELGDFVRLLPSSLALAQLHGDRVTAEALLALLEASGAQGLVQYPPHQVEAVWRSLSQEVQDRFRLEIGQGRFVRTVEFPLAHGLPARVGRLRGYGNAIVPQVAAAFIQAAMR